MFLLANSILISSCGSATKWPTNGGGGWLDNAPPEVTQKAPVATAGVGAAAGADGTEVDSVTVLMYGAGVKRNSIRSRNHWMPDSGKNHMEFERISQKKQQESRYLMQ